MPARESEGASPVSENRARGDTRKTETSKPNVATIATAAEIANASTHGLSDGSPAANTIKLAGLLVGNTYEAALATNAQAYKYGNGGAFVRARIAIAAGVSTMTVVSLDSSAVTATPTR